MMKLENICVFYFSNFFNSQRNELMSFLGTSVLFKNTQLLVNNTIDLITSNKPHPFLKMERKFDEETLRLIFNSEMLGTSFEIKLIEVPMNPIELLTKRVERLE
jgi:hypothetical protein